MERSGLETLRFLLSVRWKPSPPRVLCAHCYMVLHRDGIVLGSQCPTGVDA